MVVYFVLVHIPLIYGDMNFSPSQFLTVWNPSVLFHDLLSMARFLFEESIKYMTHCWGFSPTPLFTAHITTKNNPRLHYFIPLKKKKPPQQTDQQSQYLKLCHDERHVSNQEIVKTFEGLEFFDSTPQQIEKQTHIHILETIHWVMNVVDSSLLLFMFGFSTVRPRKLSRTYSFSSNHRLSRYQKKYN